LLFRRPDGLINPRDGRLRLLAKPFAVATLVDQVQKLIA